jgi:hypothetical protein
MDNGRRDAEPVTWGRWQEAHRALEERVEALEESEQKRLNRRWAIYLAILTTLLFPLVVGVVVLAVNGLIGH